MSAVELPLGSRLEQEACALIADATADGATVRLIGGMGIRLLLGAAYPENLAREYRDLDVFVRRADARRLEAVAAAHGWAPAVEFNALNGNRRLLFHDPASEAQIDVFVDAFEMCHSLPLAEGLARAGALTLAAEDLLMTKLQIVHLNAKDRDDIYALLTGCTDGAGPVGIDLARLSAVTGSDWGTHHTFTLNLGRLLDGLSEGRLLPQQIERVRARLHAIAAAMEDGPKSRAWRLRARIGERKRWYEEPEEVDRD